MRLCEWHGIVLRGRSLNAFISDIFAVHAVGGFIGSLCNGFFAQASVAALDGSVIKGGFLESVYHFSEKTHSDRAI